MSLSKIRNHGDNYQRPHTPIRNEESVDGKNHRARLYDSAISNIAQSNRHLGASDTDSESSDECKVVKKLEKATIVRGRSEQERRKKKKNKKKYPRRKKSLRSVKKQIKKRQSPKITSEKLRYRKGYISHPGCSTKARLAHLLPFLPKTAVSKALTLYIKKRNC